MPSDTLYTPQQKARCVAWYAATQSQAQVQINFRREYGRNAQVPSSSGILNWYNKFLETGTMSRKKKDSNAFRAGWSPTALQARSPPMAQRAIPWSVGWETWFSTSPDANCVAGKFARSHSLRFLLVTVWPASPIFINEILVWIFTC